MKKKGILNGIQFSRLFLPQEIVCKKIVTKVHPPQLQVTQSTNLPETIKVKIKRKGQNEKLKELKERIKTFTKLQGKEQKCSDCDFSTKYPDPFHSESIPIMAKNS